MKRENEIPEFVRLADVTTLYKGKGPKSNLINDRGIFIVTIIRSILMKLIYQDYYSQIDESMSDSQVGARKGRNIRNHIWIVNGIISDVLSSKANKPIDIGIYDYRQCFDSLWLKECLNDLYTAGLNDDKFALLYNVNSKVNIAVKTPVGKTDRQTIHNVITQGDVFGPIFCSKQVDTFGQECLEESKHTYLYRGEVDIPPLSMVDDLLCVSECGVKTTMMHAFIKSKTDSKKLQFGAHKCKKLHVGRVKEDHKCQALMVDDWKEVEMRNEETGIDEIEDICEGEEKMEDTQEEKYLGDVISSDGRNIKNVKARIKKGKGIVTRILTILEGIPFGDFYFEIGVLLRNALLVSSMLCNSEAWWNVTKTELDLLETIDVKFLRNMLKVPKSTPKEMLFLETGCIPFRDLIQQRRILFLHHILNEKEGSLMHKFFQTQLKTMKKKDWVATVLEDIQELQLNLTLDNLKKMKKSEIKNILNKSVKQKAFEKLQKTKKSHSKVMNLKHTKLQMQSYLKSSKLKIKTEEARTIFKLRSRMADVKTNYKGKYKSFECDLCKEGEENQEHLMKCKEILRNKKNDETKLEYEKMFEFNTRNQLAIAKQFDAHTKIRNRLLKES